MKQQAETLASIGHALFVSTSHAILGYAATLFEEVLQHPA
jgi:hypothetical protein